MGGARVLTQVDDAGPEKLVSGPVHYFDGRHDNWNPPAEPRHL
jgi:hypothetical protein